MHTNLLDALPKFYTGMFLSLYEQDHNMIALLAKARS